MRNVDPIPKVIEHMRAHGTGLITGRMPPIVTRPDYQPYPSHLREAEINALRIKEWDERAAFFRDSDERARRAAKGRSAAIRHRCRSGKQPDLATPVVARRRIGGAR